MKGRVGLFVTCLVDLFRPAVGFAAAGLIERAGYAVEVPPQGCCGQPNFNGGDRAGAAEIAARVLETFGGFDYVVAPSGSCAAMIRHDVDDPEDLDGAGFDDRHSGFRLADLRFLHHSVMKPEPPRPVQTIRPPKGLFIP